jgi:hypothetical protein
MAGIMFAVKLDIVRSLDALSWAQCQFAPLGYCMGASVGFRLGGARSEMVEFATRGGQSNEPQATPKTPQRG